MLSKNLELSIRINEDDFEVDIYEPESGNIAQLQLPYSPDEHPEFDERIGREINTWVSLWMDELEDCDDEDAEHNASENTADNLPKSNLPKEDEDGICPICGGELELHDNEIDDDGTICRWECQSCHATGKSGYNAVFDAHYDVRDSDGNPIEGRAD